ncbi:hypothetical protein D3C84_487100 [compost metagenome]
MLIKMVDTYFLSSISCSLVSATYFTIPFWNPSVEIVSNVPTKFLKFPTSANPLGPTKTAITLEVINPINSFKITLKLLREVILNKLVWVIFFIKFNLIFI